MHCKLETMALLTEEHGIFCNTFELVKIQVVTKSLARSSRDQGNVLYAFIAPFRIP
jgi:hypothetical protein